LLLAMIFSLAVGTSTEISQIMVAGRATSLSDLLANWLGVFAVGFVVSYRQGAMRQEVVR
jgi:VanZ family protein